MLSYDPETRVRDDHRQDSNLTPPASGRGTCKPLDIIEIHQLLGLYGHVVDAQEWDRFDELFTHDAVLDYTAVRAPQIFHGVDEIRDYFRAANHPSAHHVTNIVVLEVDGEVHVHSKFLAPYTRASHDSPAMVWGRLPRRGRAHVRRLALPSTLLHEPMAIHTWRTG